MIKALFFDIDGTLVSFKTHCMPQSTIEAIETARAKGLKIFIATGRHYSVINNLGDMRFDGYITMNGCYCLTGDEKVIYKKSIPQSDTHSLLSYMETNTFPCAFVEEHKLSVNMIDKNVSDLFHLLNFKNIPTEPLSYYQDKEIFQLSAFFPTETEDDIMKHLPHCETMRWYPTFTDVISKGVDKGMGISKMCEYFGFSVNETMAFGDGGNDIQMLEHAGIGIAMGNARDEVKAVADYVTDSVDEDGIRNALKHFGIV